MTFLLPLAPEVAVDGEKGMRCRHHRLPFPQRNTPLNHPREMWPRAMGRHGLVIAFSVEPKEDTQEDFVEAQTIADHGKLAAVPKL